MYGLIVGWLPATKTDEALWHVQHLDGDEEDLDEKEVLEYLAQSEEDLAAAAASGLGPSTSSASLSAAAGKGSSSAEVIDLCDEPVAAVKKSDSSSALTSSTSSRRERKPVDPQTGSDDEEAEFDMDVEEEVQKVKEEIPRIVQLQSGVYRGTPSWRAPPLTNSVGASGLRLELSRVLNLMSDELKYRDGALNRESRKLWDNSLREAETSAELRAPLLELENLVRNLQTVEDKRDAEEVRLAKEEEKKEMIEEGWIFENDVHGHIGKLARRFFKGFDSSDGQIVAYLPPEKNDSIALYHMQHNDGDSEDLELDDLLRAFRYYEQDAQEEDAEDGDESDNEDDEGSASEGDESDEEEEEDRLHAPGAGATLWPTFEVRARWLAALGNAATLGEVALALHAFLEQATAFGMVAQDVANTAEKALAPRSARLAANVAIKASLKDVYIPEPVLSSRSGGGRSSSSSRNRAAKNKAKFSAGRERLSRAAARSVRSYAE